MSTPCQYYSICTITTTPSTLGNGKLKTPLQLDYEALCPATIYIRQVRYRAQQGKQVRSKNAAYHHLVVKSTANLIVIVASSISPVRFCELFTKFKTALFDFIRSTRTRKVFKWFLPYSTCEIRLRSSNTRFLYGTSLGISDSIWAPLISLASANGLKELISFKPPVDCLSIGLIVRGSYITRLGLRE